MSSFILPGDLVFSTNTNDFPEYLRDLIEVSDTRETWLGPARARGATTARTDVGELADDDIVEIRLEGGLKLWQSVADTRADFAAVDRSLADQTLLVPRTLQIGDGEGARDGAGFAVEGIKIIRSKVVGEAGELTAFAVAHHIESKLELGLHRCTRDTSGDRPVIGFSKPDFGSIDLSERMLVLVHGTFSSTQGSFSDLVDTLGVGHDLWAALEAAFPAGIYALEHRSVTVSPLHNALDLAKGLPKEAKVSLLTHSRGGLVAELLVRGARLDPKTGKRLDSTGYDETDRRLLAKEDADLLDQLDLEIKNKNLNVERLIRIGGPLGGTTLASKRLDRALSIALNALELVAPPLHGSMAFDLFKSFLLGFIKAKEDRLQGLEAMMPEAGLIRLLNRQDVLSVGRLHIITGDNEGKGIFRRLRNLAVDLFFEDENDFVVNTPSMIRGLKRESAISVTPIVSGEITHFSYFRNEVGRAAILAAANSAPGAGLAKVAEVDLRLEAAPRTIEVSRARDKGNLPVCFYLPGVMGSHLNHDGDWIWSNPLRMAFGGFEHLRMPGEGVTPGGMMSRYYGDLAHFLSRSHDVVLFPYDWREDVRVTARRLGEAVRRELAETDKPIRFLAHSMGGLVVRALIDADPALWNDIRRRSGSRFVMLGTPNGGSFSMVHLMLGRAKAIRQLDWLDLTNSQEELLEIVTSIPGPAQLLPSDANGHYLRRATWEQLHSLHGKDWVVPQESVLKDARDAHLVFNRQHLDPGLVCYVAGCGRDLTLSGIRIDQSANGSRRVVFLGTREGDGTVTWATGIPPTIEPYYMDAVHGDLARTASAFPAIVDLLATGQTAALSKTKPAHARDSAGPAPVVVEERIEVFPNREDLVDSFLGAGAPPKARQAAKARQTRVTIRHGDLRFTPYPVLVGHYKGDPIDGAEAALDRCLDNALTAVRDLSLYPGAIETCEVILRRDRNPSGAVVAGLGQFGDLTPGQLSRTVNRAVLRYVLTLRRQAAEQGIAPEEMDEIRLATLIIGHKGANMTVQQSVHAILEAVAAANLTLDTTPVAHLEFVEVFEDTAHKAANAVDSACLNGPIAKKFSFDRRISTREGSMLRLDYGLEEDDWQRISATQSDDGVAALEFTVIADGAKARFERAAIDMNLIERLLEQSRAGTATNRDLGLLLFQLMVPLELKAFAQNDQKIQLIVDDKTAKYPWELLEDAVSVLGEGIYQGADQSEFRPLVVRTPVLRQLSSPGAIVPRVGGRKALVVGDPEATGLAPLSGAREEAQLVAKLLQRDGGFDVSSFIATSNAIEILTHVLRSDYKIMHFATHGIYEANGRSTGSGLVLSNGINLTTASLNGIEATPEFVFLNCCHIGRIDSADKDSGAIAAELSRTFINKGVRAVIAAGWAVDDAAAKLFATEFYDSMFNGNRFGDAVFHARRMVFDRFPETNTWGAYQCYGDPNYRFNERDEEALGARRRRTFYSLDHARKAAVNIAGEVRSPHRSRDDLIAELDGIFEATDHLWRKDARWSEAMGRAYCKLGVYERAIELLEQAKANHRSTMTVHALELLEHLKVRSATASWTRAQQKAGTTAGNGGTATKEETAARKELEDRIQAALDTLDGLDRVIGTKSERREVLKGTVCKRKVLTCSKKAQREKALKDMVGHYRSAMEIAALKNPKRLKPHPSYNWLSGQLLLGSTDAEGEPYDALFSRLLAQNKDEENAAPTFWTAVLPAEVDILRGMLAEPDAQASILQRIEKTVHYAWTRGGAFGQARSIQEHVHFLKKTAGTKKQIAWLSRVEAFLSVATWTGQNSQEDEF